jgi:hypothetical protein
MKNFAVILFLAVIGLSVSAPLWEQQVEDMYETSQNSSACDDDCSADCSSPFHVCNHCHGFTVSKHQPEYDHLAHCDFCPIPYSQHYFSLFYEDIWQPPKVG